MASIDSIKASDGSGNASVATVQTARSAGATTLIVDTVQGINTNFHGSMGTPHTFTDPVTGETITIISEATAVDFKGHVDGSNLEIDTIAPGYTDAGSEVGDIVIIKPTTQEQDEVAEILEVSHDDDGKLKDDAPITGGYDLSALVNGWVAANESWTYDGWTAATRIATITVPTDATTKYQAGDRVKFTQPTDGVKYGIIVKVAATLLTVFLPSGTDFDNEAITAPYFSRAKVPFGFNADPNIWKLEFTDTANRTQASPTNGVWYNPGSLSLTVGIGAWDLEYEACPHGRVGASSAARIYITLSTANNSESDTSATYGSYVGAPSSGVVETIAPAHKKLRKILTAATTFYLNVSTAAGHTNAGIRGDFGMTIIRAVCAYL